MGISGWFGASATPGIKSSYTACIRDAWLVCADATVCHLDEFFCDGVCISRYKLCDYDVDCVTDGSDESPLVCSKYMYDYIVIK